MRRTTCTIALFAAGAAAGISPALRAEEASRANKWFVGADVGLALQQDVDVKEALGTPVSGAKIEFDPGVRFDVVGGYHFTDQLSVTLEAGYTFNSLKSIAGTTLSGSGGDIDFNQFPILANVSYTFPLEARIKPFIGAGLGGVFGVADFSGTAAGLPSGDTQSAVSFGYQGFAGARYEINDRMEVGLLYKFLGTTDQEFDDFKIEGTRTHTLGVSFLYRF